MKLSSVMYYVQSPWRIPGRMYYALYRRFVPDCPWLSQGAITFLDRTLKPHMKGFEWGSGASTLWFSKRLGHLTSVEHHQEWYEYVRGELHKRHIKHVDLHHIALEHSVAEFTVRDYDPMPKYVECMYDIEDASLDVVVIDGHYRLACVPAAEPKLKSGGMLLIDNTDWMRLEAWHVPASWPMIHQSKNAVTQTTIWRKP